MGQAARIRAACYRLLCAQIGNHVRIAKPDQISGMEFLFIGSNVAIGSNARIEAIRTYQANKYFGEIHIGSGTIINPYVHIAAATRLEIGKNVLLASRISILDHDHQFSDLMLPVQEQPLTVKPVKIGDCVWIGENAVILKGVTIGHHAIIGAGSIVISDIPPYGIAVGVPAKVIRVRES